MRVPRLGFEELWCQGFGFEELGLEELGPKARVRSVKFPIGQGSASYGSKAMVGRDRPSRAWWFAELGPRGLRFEVLLCEELGFQG